MASPSPEWTLTASSTRLLDVLNSISGALPLATWRPHSLVRARERLARALGMGHLEMSGVMPSGHTGTLMPQQMYVVDDSRATLDGVDLGLPVHLPDHPRIGEVPLPARGVLAIGQAVWKSHPTVVGSDLHRATSGRPRSPSSNVRARLLCGAVLLSVTSQMSAVSRIRRS